MNPNYAAWLNHPDQRIDWTGVGLDLGTILGGSYGGIAIGEVRGFIGWAIAYWSEYLDMGDRYGDPTDPND